MTSLEVKLAISTLLFAIMAFVGIGMNIQQHKFIELLLTRLQQCLIERIDADTSPGLE